MARYFEPSLSYRLSDKGGGIRDFGVLSPGGRLTQFDSILFFVHGYNNDQEAASASYKHFVELLGTGVRATIVGVYWPGDNWSHGAYYLGALAKVRTIARRFARDIHDAAVETGKLEISFVAHSLGCRLTLETIHALNELLRHQPVAGLKLRRVVFMAGAVPTDLLEQQQPLNTAVQHSGIAAKSLYSEADRVLHYAFPLGQTLAGGGFFPTALGRTHWRGASALNPALQQAENPTADHSDYWGSASTNAVAQQHAALEVRGFIPLGGPPAPRTTPSHLTTTARHINVERATATRST